MVEATGRRRITGQKGGITGTLEQIEARGRSEDIGQGTGITGAFLSAACFADG